MRMRLALATLVVALAMPSLAHASDADLKKRFKAITKENEKLSRDLAKEQAESNAAFSEASGAEAAAGMTFTSMTVAVPAPRAEAAPPLNVEYIRMHVRHADFSMVPTSFTAARIVANHRLYTGIESVKKAPHR